jgi:catechol 2,3-dioxygenase-like lactoylglutathione lyase family enzyme
MAASVRFYTEFLGMEIVSSLESPSPRQGQVVGLRSPGSAQLLELNWFEPGSRFGSPLTPGEELDHLAFECRNVASVVEHLEPLGVQVVIRPREVDGWNEACVRDPNGIWIELIPRHERPKLTG